MIVAAFILHLSLWVASTKAFFPWDACRADNRCSDSGLESRTIRGFGNVAGDESSEGLTFEIFERSHPVIHPHARRASRDFFRLSEKYARRHASGGEDLEKRKNGYAVREPAAPEEANAEGIYQDESDYAHFIKAEIGSEKQPLYLLVDTGAGATWVMGSKCTSEACKSHDTYDPSSSKSLNDTPRNFTIAYGSGQVEGHNIIDKINLGNVEIEMEFGVAHDTSSDFEHFAFDGILGMSLNKGSTENMPQIIKGDKKLDKNIFSVFLSRGPNGPNNGELTLGGTNDKKYAGDITYTDVADSNGDWAIPIDSIKMDGKEAKLEKSRLGFIDTGTTYIFGPAADVKAVHELVEGAKSADNGVTWTVPCDTTLELAFTFSGRAWVVLPQDWIAAPDANGVCQSNVYGHEVVSGAWLLGAQFLKNVYTIFDFQGDTAKIGFAKHANPDSAKAPGTMGSQTPGTTTPPSGRPDMGVGGRETTSSVTAEPASTGGSNGSSNGGEMVSSNHLRAVVVTCATMVSILRFL